MGVGSSRQQQGSSLLEVCCQCLGSLMGSCLAKMSLLGPLLAFPKYRSWCISDGRLVESKHWLHGLLCQATPSQARGRVDASEQQAVITLQACCPSGTKAVLVLVCSQSKSWWHKNPQVLVEECQLRTEYIHTKGMVWQEGMQAHIVQECMKCNGKTRTSPC